MTALLPSSEACEKAVLVLGDWTGLACSQDLGCFDVCAQLHLTLCGPMDCGLPGSSVHGILQARILEWDAISFSRDLPDPGIKPESPALAGGFFTTSAILGSVFALVTPISQHL